MVRIRHFPFKEGLLDGSENYWPCQHSLVCMRYLADLRDLSQFSNCLIFEELPGRQIHTRFSRPCDHLDAEYGISSQLEEVVPHAHLFDPQCFGPDATKNFLDRGAWSNILIILISRFWSWQRPAINLAVDR